MSVTNLYLIVLCLPCNENFGPGPKVVRGDHFWSPKFGPPGPNLTAKNGLGLEYR